MSTVIIRLNMFDKLLELSDKNEIEYDIFEGALQDNVIIYSDSRIKIPSMRKTKYIIIESVYLNTWSSELYLTVTDSDKKANEFLEAHNTCN